MHFQRDYAAAITAASSAATGRPFHDAMGRWRHDDTKMDIFLGRGHVYYGIGEVSARARRHYSPAVSRASYAIAVATPQIHWSPLLRRLIRALLGADARPTGAFSTLAPGRTIAYADTPLPQAAFIGVIWRGRGAMGVLAMRDAASAILSIAWRRRLSCVL